MIKPYDIAIAGGGLAGLSAAILLSGWGHAVVLIEKEIYPFHRVCGEYVGMESWNFLQQLGLPLQDMDLPRIKKLWLTAPNGKALDVQLDPGGFGISRFLLDQQLANLAVSSGVTIMQGTRVEAITGNGPFTLSLQGQEALQATVCCAAWGKRSNMDVNWKRDFIASSSARLENFVGVKYHVRTNWPEDKIALHNFEDGYCGISNVENGISCLCYLIRAQHVKAFAGNLEAMEKKVLSKNPALSSILNNCVRLENFPVTISQISFARKQQVENGVLMLGDAAGMITPLCGNGMSIALHTGKLAAMAIHDFLVGKMNRKEMEHRYALKWKKHFSGRLRAGRQLQRFFGSSSRSNFLVGAVRNLPFLSAPLVRLTHGQPF